MPLQTLVKVSAVNNLSDARYCAGMGVALAGFPLDRTHAHYLAPEPFKTMTQWITGIALVGELHTTDPTVVHQELEHYALDYLQLSHPMAPSTLQQFDIPILLKLTLQGNESFAALQALMETYAPYVKYFLLASTATHQDALAALQPTVDALARQFPILQGFHVSTNTLPHLLATDLQGIALQGGVETKPGYKDFDELADVLEYLTEH